MTKVTKLHYNSPLILTFSFLCIVCYYLLDFLQSLNSPFFVLRSSFSFVKISDYSSVFLYVLNHANPEHLFGNLTFILLLGPILEEKYGRKKLFYMIVVTTLATAILNIIFFNTGLIGASGIVFMLIILISFVNVEDGRVPLTFIMVFVLFISKEVYASFENDQISQFAHIIGGILGAIFGFTNKSKTIE